MEVSTETRYFNEKSLASYIDTSQHTLKYWRKTGQGPKFITLPNGRIRYRKEDMGIVEENNMCFREYKQRCFDEAEKVITQETKRDDKKNNINRTK